MSGGRIERPRGTHDVVPAEQPSWRRVTGELERLCTTGTLGGKQSGLASPASS